MIPKIIHYIWFGHSPYPEKVQYCLNSWKRHLPDYEFRLWNEDTFDVNSVLFTKEAYENKKWAFVSDYVRLYALYKEGGWYLDTDYEVLRSFNGLENHRMVLGTDDGGYLAALMGTEPKHPFIKEMLDYYQNMKFVLPNGNFQMAVINSHLEKMLAPYGYNIKNEYQELQEDIVVYPDEYFSVLSLENGSMHRTENSYSIHWHTLLWISPKQKFVKFIRLHIVAPLLGPNLLKKLKKLCGRK